VCVYKSPVCITFCVCCVCARVGMSRCLHVCVCVWGGGGGLVGVGVGVGGCGCGCVGGTGGGGSSWVSGVCRGRRHRIGVSLMCGGVCLCVGVSRVCVWLSFSMGVSLVVYVWVGEKEGRAGGGGCFSFILEFLSLVLCGRGVLAIYPYVRYVQVSKETHYVANEP
jgi:hypothetical protein